MEEIKYIGKYRPKGYIVDVEEDRVEPLIESGEYERLVMKKKPKKSDNPKKKEKEKEKEVESPLEIPTSDWTEMEIYDWLKRNSIPINYIPARDTKKYVLKEIRKRGYIKNAK